MTARRPRHSRDELRHLLLETGRTMLSEDGLGTGAEALTFKRVFDRLEDEHGIRLTNASVIGRVWRNQAEFQADVLAAIALTENENEFDHTIGIVGPILAAADVTTPAARTAVLRELCRVGGAANLQAMRESTNWPMWISVWAVAAGQEPREDRKKLVAALMSGYESFNDKIEVAYTAILDFLGFRLRSPFTVRQFTVAADSLGQGCGLRDRVDDAQQELVIRDTGPGGTPQEWTLFAIAFEALVHQFFEIDPDWHPDPGDA
jgi:hypothetical protein